MGDLRAIHQLSRKSMSTSHWEGTSGLGAQPAGLALPCSLIDHGGISAAELAGAMDVAGEGGSGSRATESRIMAGRGAGTVARLCCKIPQATDDDHSFSCTTPSTTFSMQFTVLVAAFAVCTGVFASPYSQHTQAQATSQAAQSGQAAQTWPFGWGYGGLGAYGGYGWPYGRGYGVFY
ncbi:hypothetical protein PtA15_4A182 [Puccinia triticina]|uniref:Uncharacterized protein n=1 Tax=Puccinia triticina TaxID=208348 RepID=A0ABY7CF82_9BASI|nr:uncharacterized protein PtA15_4A182 [Puccinia triticina]WAQ83734.1 hypothetical protein PtA15_4A182 [Puccinia triticina]WAR54576.1 hypothetical protein PtB15_4B193 [Puccinia triticina]